MKGLTETVLSSRPLHKPATLAPLYYCQTFLWVSNNLFHICPSCRIWCSFKEPPHCILLIFHWCSSMLLLLLLLLLSYWQFLN